MSSQRRTKATTYSLIPLVLSIAAAMQFKPPDPETRLRAIGPIDGLSPAMRRALEPGMDFSPIPVPGPHDWLATHFESGQTYQQFLGARPNRPDAVRHTIYLQPLGKFPAGTSPPLELLQKFARAFFAMEVEVLPTASIANRDVTTRIHSPTGRIQMLTGDLLTLLRRLLPRDGFCILGLTMSDLYPEPSWNFVFGQASLREGVAVYSFARYDPGFYGETVKNPEELILRRSVKILAHETAHMFGIHHCVYFHCVMNGSNHLQEADARPLHLCPVDLRKLHHSAPFDIVHRYRELRDFYREVDFQEEVRWLEQRLAHLTGR